MGVRLGDWRWLSKVRIVSYLGCFFILTSAMDLLRVHWL